MKADRQQQRIGERYIHSDKKRIEATNANSWPFSTQKESSAISFSPTRTQAQQPTHNFPSLTFPSIQ